MYMLLKNSVRFLNFIFIFALNLQLNSANASIKPTFSVLDWNILGPNTRDAAEYWQDKNSFLKREVLKGDYSRIINEVSKLILEQDASIICLQEVDRNSLEILNSKLIPKGYTQVAYQDKGPNSGSVIFVKKNEFEVLGSQGLKLEGTQASDIGAAAIGILKSNKTGAIFAVSSVHISRSEKEEGKETGDKQLKALQKRCENFY